MSSTPEAACGTLHARTHDLHGGRFGGLQNRAQLEIPAGFDERLPDQVGFIAEFGGYFVDLCGNFGIYAAAVVQCAVYRSAGYARKIRDLLCGDSHCDSSLYYNIGKYRTVIRFTTYLRFNL